ncbi:hypothetical protein K505DRAFT_373641 [Melanomma pulvis-pyrius CBS 109.77]|uniref:Uncharacterized protein n=1 Tax=Melanomma pulvis-pyrius CBS 109.77 TaxID=1314802 RepID=A0A6A6XI44_9PLEO|nr:hypothetical protein K505DRAFT_373641 [Melanomma pulvis-pyrius CBS 109.77]
MVLEAFAALSLTANIVQFIDFGGKLFSKARQVHHSKDGFSKDHADLESATKSLKQLMQHLSSSTTTITIADNISHDEEELIRLAKDCIGLADELIQLLEKVRGTGRRTKWESFVQAIRMVWNEKDIDHVKDRLNQYQTRMTLCLLKILKDNQSNVIKMLVELSDQVIQSDKDTKSLLDMKISLNKELGDLKSSMHSITHQANETSSKLGNIASILSKLATNGNRLATERRILKSLRFRSMKVRHAQIPEAHKKTFEWAYTSHKTSDHSCKQFKFAEWLRSGTGLYWISGKAGSGKSTLVKFLYDNPRTTCELRQWAGNNDIATAGFFFWNSGTEMQKSVEGLLQSLLFELFRKCPSLIPIATPTRWDERESYHSDPALWSQWELKGAFKLIQQQATINAKFCLFIDGLDEYEGNHSDVIEILQGLAKSKDIKICVSSRPWNVFQETFGQNHDCRLFLEELTKPDIELFVRDTLESNSHFLSLREMDTRYQALVEEIVQKADGIFLWVFLIVRSLLQGLVNCDRISELQRRIRLLPSKLEEYFLQMLTSTDETYYDRAAESFDIALRASQPLSLMAYSYIDEEEPEFAINVGIKPLTCREVLYRLRTMKRRLNARCNGLLEITNFDEDQNKREHYRRTIDDFWSSSTQLDDTEASELFMVYKVEFLHRTVKDFLNTKEIQNLVKSRIPNDFQPLAVVCRAILAQIKTLPVEKKFYARHFKELVDDLIYYTQVSDSHSYRPELETLDELERTLCILDSMWQIRGASASLNEDPTIKDLQKSFFEYMVRNGLCGYMSQKLAMSKRSLPPITKLLASALKPSMSLKYGRMYYPSMVQLLIDSSKEDRTSAWCRIELPPLWIDFLVSIPVFWNQISTDAKLNQVQIIQMLLDVGADPNQRQGEGFVWAETLGKLRRATEDGKANPGKTEEMEIIESYKKMFLAYDVDYSLVI